MIASNCATDFQLGNRGCGTADEIIRDVSIFELVEVGPERDDGDLLAGHGVHVLEGLQEADLDCGLHLEDVGGLAVELRALEVRLRRDDLALHVAARLADGAEVAAEQGGQPHVLEDDLLHVHAPPLRHLLHELRDLLVDLGPPDQQVLQDLAHGHEGHLCEAAREVADAVGGPDGVDDAVEDGGVDVDTDVVLGVDHLVRHVDHFRLHLHCLYALRARVVVVQARLQRAPELAERLDQSHRRRLHPRVRAAAEPTDPSQAGDVALVRFVLRLRHRFQLQTIPWIMNPITRSATEPWKNAQTATAPFTQTQRSHSLSGFARGLILFFIEILYIYSGASMNQRPFSPVTGEPFKVENYYFQLILQRLLAKRPPPACSLAYSVGAFKGNTKFEISKPIVLELGSAEAYSLAGTKLNFVAISYNPSKDLSYAIRLIENGKESDKEVGEYMLDANNFIDHFRQTENGAFTLKVDFNEDWAAEAELYVERSRYGVERLVKEVKNPKPKEDGEAVPISHQAIKEKRRQLDLEEEEEVPHANRFKKFSPKRESHEDIQKKNQHLKRKTEEPPKREIVPEAKKEEKKSPKGEFVPKKEWIIPEAEKYIASKTKSSSRSNSIRVDEKPPSVLQEEKAEPRRAPKPAAEEPWLNKLPYQTRYIVLVALVVALLMAASFFIKSEQPQDLLKPSKLPKPKKTTEKIEKPKKTVKVKK